MNKRQGPAQDVRFLYAHSHLMPQNFAIYFYQPISIKFYIKISDETFQFLNCVIGQKHLKIALRLFYQLTYSFVAIYFWCYS